MIGKPEESNTGVSGEAETVLPEISGKATFLLACGSDDGQTLHLAALVGADMEEQSFSIYMLDPDARVNAGLRSVSLQEHYRLGGSGELKLAAEELTGIKVDRYLYTAEKGFKTVLRTLGNGLVLNVPSKLIIAGRILPCASSQGSKRSTRIPC